MSKKPFSFKIVFQDKTTKTRAGVIKTVHGEIKTPCFVPVGSQATVKSLTPQEIEKTGTQVFFVNTYHAFLRPGTRIIEKFGGLHKFMNWEGPLMTDSGGFQVFSLGAGMGKRGWNKNLEQGTLIKIDDDGVTFRSHWDGSLHRFTPEKSIQIQKKLGADMILAFDECAAYPVTKKRAKKAMERTHRWALRCLKAAQGKASRSLKAAQTKLPKKASRQALYGVIQGGVYKDLREESARFVSSLGFDGIAIGGVSVGESKRQMCQVCDWVIPFLPQAKPRHLLGVGEIDDIFNIIEQGIDTFDCVMPTRLGRMGHALIKNEKLKIKNEKFRIDITKSIFAQDPRPIEESCQCFTCRNFSRAYINHLFRVRELLGYRLATIHNLYFVNSLVSQIREAIEKGKFLELKIKWL